VCWDALILRRRNRALGERNGGTLSFVTGIAAEFPAVPHRYCDNHFLRDLAKPVLEADSHAKVQMRKKVRGLRQIEQAVLQRRSVEAKGEITPAAPEATAAAAASQPPAVVDPGGSVVLDYCAAVRGAATSAPAAWAAWAMA